MERDACRSCGSTVWYQKRTVIDKGEFFDRCSECDSGLRTSTSADVYFKPGPDGVEYHPNICDRNGDPIPLTSRAHKAEVMRQKNLREAGDPIRGSRNFDPIAYRHAM